MPHLRGHHRLGRCGERGVAHCDRLVVGERAILLRERERLVREEQGEHEIGLLHDLLAVQIEVGEVVVQQVLLGVRRLEVPPRQIRVARRLRVHAPGRVERDVHRVGRRLPSRDLLRRDAEAIGDIGMGASRRRGAPQVQLHHEVGVHVVVHHGGVLVGPRDAVDVEGAALIAAAEREPQARRLHQHLDTALPLEIGVARRAHVLRHGHRDVGVDVERRRAGRPVPRALAAVDRAPGERGALETQQLRTIAGMIERRVAPAQRLLRGARRCRDEHRQHEGLEIPERVPLVARPREPLARDRAQLQPRRGLMGLE